MSPELAAAIKAVVLPPGLNLFLALAGFALLPLRKRMALLLIAFALLLLYFLSTPMAARPLAEMLEQRNPALAPGVAPADAGAIVVPGCDRYRAAPEFGRDEASACTLVRLRYAVELHARTGIPLLLSGGSPFGEETAEAELMRRALADHFGVETGWLETQSRNTAENAAYSAKLLGSAGIRRIYLVTHALHMARARRSFERQGLKVVAAPTGFYATADPRPAYLQFLPSISALVVSHQALHELLGLARYGVTGK